MNFHKEIFYGNFAKQNRNETHLFYVNALGWVQTTPEFFIEREQYYDFEIKYIVSGKFHVVQHNKKYIVNPGEMILMNLFDYHKYYPDVDDPCDILWIHFNGQGCEKLIAEIEGYKKLPLIMSPPPSFAEIIKKCLNLYNESQNNSEAYISLYIHELLTEILQPLPHLYLKTKESIEQQFLINSMDHYIDEHLNEKVTLNMLSKEACLSPFHFSRVFNAYTGKSPIQYVLQKKVEKSKVMLLYTNKTVSLISEELGFADISHFSRAFHKIEGISPKKFRTNVF
ncbi:MAG: AraC family transcriptional regulator [Clostridia bacterium]